MRVFIDTETNALHDYTKLWVIICRDIDTDEIFRFIRPDLAPRAFLEFSSRVSYWVGHNILRFDLPVLKHFNLAEHIEIDKILDTLVVSRLVNQALDGGHSQKAWGERLGAPKTEFNKFEHLSQEMIDYCISDTLTLKKIYEYHLKFIESDRWQEAIKTEHMISYVAHEELHKNGMKINLRAVNRLLLLVNHRLDTISRELQEDFLPKSKLIREINPKRTLKGTLNQKDFRWLSQDTLDLTPYEEDSPFSLFEFIPFNPASQKQCIELLHQHGWKPVNKTKGHYKEERERHPDKDRMNHFRVYGWSLDEENLATLPEEAPESIRKLVRWLMLDARRERLLEWKMAVRPSTGRIHGTWNTLGTWTHRASHTDPNMGNVPSTHPKYNPKGQLYAEASQLGGLMRAVWQSDTGYLIGTDADGIQLRILAHYMNDERFTNALINGRKEDRTDAHSLNALALGPICQGRDPAKTFIYAWLLGAGFKKVSQILKCSTSEAKEAVAKFIQFYPGLERLKNETIAFDARRGYFEGIDGRWVIPKGEDEDQRAYYMLGGYLQNGEAIVMKKAALLWREALRKERIPYRLVNWIHDEYQTETLTKDYKLAEHIGQIQVQAIEKVGQLYNLRCPLTGQSKIGFNWNKTH